ncbi:hypothetical protein BUE80_DR011473 [Diplocarpon rosae]|nr:hypothetical protein BUE80_DR011473 [Diplocarpon rosae]
MAPAWTGCEVRGGNKVAFACAASCIPPITLPFASRAALERKSLAFTNRRKVGSCDLETAEACVRTVDYICQEESKEAFADEPEPSRRRRLLPRFSKRGPTLEIRRGFSNGRHSDTIHRRAITSKPHNSHRHHRP